MEQTAPRYPNIYEALLNERPIIPPDRPMEIDSTYAMIDAKRLNVDDTAKSKSRVFLEFETYFDQKYNAELHNYSILLYIYDFIKTERDKNKLESLCRKMDEFKRVIMKTIKPYPVLRIDFGRYKYPTRINNLQECESYQEIEWKE